LARRQSKPIEVYRNNDTPGGSSAIGWNTMEPHRLLQKRTDHVCGLLPLDGYN
jgi:hypothetical protein